MQAIDNANLTGMCYNCGLPGFAPAIAYTYDGSDVVLTDTTVAPTGDTLVTIHYKVHSVRTGDEVRGNDDGGGQVTTIDVTSLDNSKGLNITATITTENHAIADGSAFAIGAAGNLGGWDAQQNA